MRHSSSTSSVYGVQQSQTYRKSFLQVLSRPLPSLEACERKLLRRAKITRRQQHKTIVTTRQSVYLRCDLSILGKYCCLAQPLVLLPMRLLTVSATVASLFAPSTKSQFLAVFALLSTSGTCDEGDGALEVHPELVTSGYLLLALLLRSGGKGNGVQLLANLDLERLLRLFGQRIPV